jgi:hypothetical protein
MMQRPVKALLSLPAVVIAGLLLTACGDNVGVVQSTGAAVSGARSTSPVTPAPPAPPASPTTGSATLSWSAPTENTDGTPLTDLAGYHIYYGTTNGAWTSTVTVLDAAETSYVVSGLSSGTYYFTVAAFNSEGVDSPDSNVGSKTI